MRGVAIRPATLIDLPILLSFDHVAAHDQSRREFICHAITDKTCVVATLDEAVVCSQRYDTQPG